LGKKSKGKLSKNRKLIIESIIQKPKITIPKLADKIGISTTAIEKNIKYLKENKFIKRIGRTKGGHWEVIKY